MDGEILRKIIEMIQLDVEPLIVTKPDGSATLLFKYDRSSCNYMVELTRKPENEIKRKELSGIDELLPFITNSEFTDSFVSVYNDRINEENKFSSAKYSILKELDTLNVPDKLKQTMEVIVDQVCQLPERVGTNNRFPISDSEHIRLADETKWNYVGNDLHLQLVEAHGSSHFYPDFSLEELTNLVNQKCISLEPKAH